MIAAMCDILTKIENTPDHKTIMQTLTTMQDDLKTTTNVMKITAEKIQTTATTAQKAVAVSQQAILISQDIHAVTKDINTITKEVAQAGKSATAILQETNIAKAVQSAPPTKSSYASVLSSNAAPLSKPMTLSTQPPARAPLQYLYASNSSCPLPLYLIWNLFL